MRSRVCHADSRIDKLQQCVVMTHSLSSYSTLLLFSPPSRLLIPIFLFCHISFSICQFSLAPPDFPWGFFFRWGDIGGGVDDDVLIPHTHTLQTGRALKLYAVADYDSDPSLGDKQCWEWEWERDRKRTKARGFITFESCISNGRLNIMFKNVFILMHHTELAGWSRFPSSIQKGFCSQVKPVWFDL